MAYNNEFCMRMDDQNFVKQWLLTVKPPQIHSNTNKSVCHTYDVKNEILEVYNMCKEIETIENLLRDNVQSMSEDVFREKIETINNLKCKIIEKKKIFLEESNIASLVKKLERRSKKRLRLKKRKVENKTKNSLLQKSNESKLKDIDKWLNNIKTDMVNKEKEAELKIKADAVLKDVNRRKAEARKNISLLDALCKLRVAREKSAIGRGEDVNQTDGRIFMSSIEKLKTLWNNALEKYKSEETNLQEMLNYSAIEDSHVVSKNDDAVQCIIGEWKNIMFGDSEAMPQRDFNGNVYYFITIRQQWDQYISHDVGASRIPFGWITPSEPSNKWKSYIKL